MLWRYSIASVLFAPYARGSSPQSRRHRPCCVRTRPLWADGTELSSASLCDNFNVSHQCVLSKQDHSCIRLRVGRLRLSFRKVCGVNFEIFFSFFSFKLILILSFLHNVGANIQLSDDLWPLTMFIFPFFLLWPENCNNQLTLTLSRVLIWIHSSPRRQTEHIFTGLK